MPRYPYKGTVVDGEGKVVRDATVVIYEYNASDADNPTVVATFYSGQSGGSAVTSVDSDVNGDFEVWVDTANYGADQVFSWKGSKNTHSTNVYHFSLPGLLFTAIAQTWTALQTFVAPELGAATGTSLDLGGTTLLASRALTIDTGGVFNVVLGAAAGDDFTVDTTKLVVEGDTGRVGIGIAAPLDLLHIEGDAVIGSGNSGSGSTLGVYGNVSIGTGGGGGYAATAAPTDGVLIKGQVVIGATSSSGKLHVDQESVTGAIPTLYLNQADVSEELIEFNTTIGVGNAIEAIGIKTLTTTHFIKITIPGGLTRYIPCGTIA